MIDDIAKSSWGVKTPKSSRDVQHRDSSYVFEDVWGAPTIIPVLYTDSKCCGQSVSVFNALEDIEYGVSIVTLYTCNRWPESRYGVMKDSTASHNGPCVPSSGTPRVRREGNIVVSSPADGHRARKMSVAYSPATRKSFASPNVRMSPTHCSPPCPVDQWVV
ncbi:hypothetical protein EDB89DRAFT_1982177 [Lactarius sanguifluus]|nr:hypothetical protein EDB89DRAFT_1982177 [Lactarius sanguifluus]